MARVLEVSFDFVVNDDETYEDLELQLHKTGIFDTKYVSIIGYDFIDDVSDSYDM